jgi:hypothetical protein
MASSKYPQFPQVLPFLCFSERVIEIPLYRYLAFLSVFPCNSPEYAAILLFVFGITSPYLLCYIVLLKFSKKHCKALWFNHVCYIFIPQGNCNESAKAKSCLQNYH